jgi:hypothetical protein
MAYICMLKYQIILNVNSFLPDKLPGFSYITIVYQSTVLIYSFSLFNLIRYKTFSETIHSFSSLSYDRSKASSKSSCPHSAIQSFLLQMRVSSPFRKWNYTVCIMSVLHVLKFRTLDGIISSYYVLGFYY